jgi:hypothetical protein
MDDLAGLEELHKTIADASEQLATFISCGNSGEVAIPSLIVAAEKTLSELAKWRATSEIRIRASLTPFCPPDSAAEISKSR